MADGDRFRQLYRYAAEEISMETIVPWHDQCTMKLESADEARDPSSPKRLLVRSSHEAVLQMKLLDGYAILDEPRICYMGIMEIIEGDGIHKKGDIVLLSRIFATLEKTR